MVRTCANCERNKNPKKPCSVWTMHGRPEKILNCRYFKDRQK